MSDYVDDRLMLWAPFYKEMLRDNHPELEEQLTDEIVQGAMIEAFIQCGHARLIKHPGGVRVEATEQYLKDIETHH